MGKIHLNWSETDYRKEFCEKFSGSKFNGNPNNPRDKAEYVRKHYYEARNNFLASGHRFGEDY